MPACFSSSPEANIMFVSCRPSPCYFSEQHPNTHTAHAYTKHTHTHTHTHTYSRWAYALTATFCSVLGSLLRFPPSSSCNSALCCNSFLLTLHLQDSRWQGLQHRRRAGSFPSLSLPSSSSVHRLLHLADCPSQYALLLHEARPVDPSDNPVFHIGKLILTQGPGADAQPILQVLEHAEYERWSLIYILLVLLSPEELHEKHCYDWESDCGLPAFQTHCVHEATHGILK